MSALLLIVLGFLFSALFSGVETGSYRINRFRLRHREREQIPSARSLARVLRDPYLFIFTVLIGNNVAVYLLSREVTDLYLAGGMEAGRLLFGVVPWNAEMAATLTLMFPLFVFAELGPKNLFRSKADILMYRVAWIMRLIVLLLLPFTWPLKQLFRLLTRGLGSDALRELHRLSPDALREFFSAGEKEGVISSHQNRMLENVATMYQMPVRALMSPIGKVPALPDTATVADFKQLVARRGVNYTLLMHRHAVVGVVSLDAVVNRDLADADLLKGCAATVLRIEEGRNLKSAFYRLRRNPRHRAVVVDAHKHPVGFVELEDIARYIAKK